ncbi:MAG: SagB/ThcOx family dehydrogenase [Leptolyngbya sp. RL_3_1]|nr:SagB/ThcOx family dehydrogenase [Leptolyngbya sp. RL_3_1]
MHPPQILKHRTLRPLSPIHRPAHPWVKNDAIYCWQFWRIATGIGFDRLVTPSDSASLADVENDVGLLYHRWSQPGYGEAIATILNWGQQPPLYKTYPDALQIDLPAPNLAAVTTPDLATTILQRRSHRNYNGSTALSLLQLSQVLHLAQGITDDSRDFRTVPSSGALYPLEIYPIVHRVEGLEPGLYHHAIQQHQLELVKAGDLRQPLIKAGLSQDFLGEAQVCFVVSGIFQRTRWKYHERTYRYVLMEAGHLGQNLYLAATALNLGVCGIGAFFDDPLNQLLDIDGETEAALYLVTIGERG